MTLIDTSAWIEFLLHSHPPIAERLALAEEGR
jgi:Zn-dependent protease with chaperone function